MPLLLIRQDITKIKCDAIVNPTNINLNPTGGLDLAIHKAAGKKLTEDCKQIRHINVGESVITPAYKLPCKHVIHTTGPVWNGGNHNEESLLKLCYTNALSLAHTNGCESLAFPLISSGTHGCPKDRVLKIAVNAITEFLLTCDMTVYLVVFDKTAFELSEKLFSSIKSFIDDNYASSHSLRQNFSGTSRNRADCPPPLASKSLLPVETEIYEECCACESMVIDDIDNYIKLDEGFAIKLMKLIDHKGMSDVECYKKANVSKQTWYKIMNDKHYKPNKKTVISFAVALELTLSETQTLLESVGFVLSNSSLFDVIIMYCLQHGVYNVLEIDSILFKYDQETLYSKF